MTTPEAHRSERSLIAYHRRGMADLVHRLDDALEEQSSLRREADAIFRAHQRLYRELARKLRPAPAADKVNLCMQALINDTPQDKLPRVLRLLEGLGTPDLPTHRPPRECQ